MKRIWKGSLAAFALTVAVTPVAVYAFCGELFPREMAAGWLVTLANAVLLPMMIRGAVGKGPNEFLLWGLWGGVMRLAAIIGILTACRFLEFGEFIPLAVTVAIGYCASLIVEVWYFRMMTLGDPEA